MAAKPIHLSKKNNDDSHDNDGDDGDEEEAEENDDDGQHSPMNQALRQALDTVHF